MSRTYTTSQGDTWDLIAYNEMGSEKLMHDLIDANPGYQDTVYFSAGVGLTIPDVPVSISSDDPVPPWQK
ncbi:MAG: tail protein X [Desulfobacterales bacterium]|nr:tail protein X [Desulfobacterales bacterium]